LAGKAAPKKNLSAIKRARQAEKNRLRNKAVKTTIKTITKKVEIAVADKNKEELQKAFAEATKIITKAASKGVLHRNTASRKVSRLARIANTLVRPEAAS
jgi:small subunit ribosomal protein S20